MGLFDFFIRSDPLHMVHGSAKALENFAEAIEKSAVNKCQRCKYPFTEKEKGKQYSLPKLGFYKQTMIYPDDFIHVCPLCKIELSNDEDDKVMNSFLKKNERYLIDKIKRWRKLNSPKRNRRKKVYSRGQKGL